MGDWFSYLFLAALLVLAVIWVDSLRSCEGKCHTCLVWDTGLFAVLLALYVGGYFVLRSFGLAWRNLPGAILFGTMMVSFWVGLGLALACFLSGWYGLAKWVILALAGMVFLVTLWLALLIFAFVYSRGDRVVEYQGQTLVEEDKSWHHSSYYYYEYHGPLVRGNKWAGDLEKTRGGRIPIDKENG